MKLLTDEKRDELHKELGDKNSLAKEFLTYLCFEPKKYHVFDTGGNAEYTFENDMATMSVCFDNSIYINGEKYESNIDSMVCYTVERHFYSRDIYVVFNLLKLFYMGDANNCVLFTGAFCPPHIGHRNLITHSLNEGYDYAVVAVSTQEFLEKKFRKAGEKSGIEYSEEQRIKMVLAMTYDIPNVLIYGVEDGYTYNVLCNVKKKYKVQHLSFACGSDKLNEIHTWGYHDRLLSEFGFYILQRGDDPCNEITRKCNELFSRYKIVKKAAEYADISSTQIRHCMKSGEDYGELVTKKVAEIMKNL